MVGDLLLVRDLKGYYRLMYGVVHGVDGVSLSIKAGEIMGLAGESGCGKSTLAELITGTLRPNLYYEGGKVIVDGFDVYKIDPEVLRTEVKCKRMAYVPQASMNCLNPVKRIRDFLLDVVKERTGKNPSKNEVLKMAGDHFQRLGLERQILNRYPHELSGGMKQRVVIAISTLWNPKLLIVDEPTSALDVTSQKRMIKMLVDLKRDGVIESIMCISHDISILRQLCTKCAIMYCGKIVEIGDMETIVNEPFHPYTKGLISSIVSYDPNRRGRGGLRSIPGMHPDLRNPPPGCRFHPRCEECMTICKTEEPPLIEVADKGHMVSCWLYE